MIEDLIYYVKGSAPEPYIVSVSLSPLSISCTCQAASVGLPCKHRIMILQGADPGILEGDISKLEIINKIAESSNVFDLLKNYDDAKAERKTADTKAEKAFKNYRDSRLRFLQKELKTDKVVIKAKNEMETAIEAVFPVEENRRATLKALQEIMPFAAYN